MTSAVRSVAATLLLALALVGIWAGDPGRAQQDGEGMTEPRPERPPVMKVEPATDPQLRQTPPGEQLAEGRRYYTTYCAGCHGAKGDGNGPAAKFLHPKPRDFTSGIFKFGSRPSGQLPTDDDLLRTLNHGLTGSSMPEWTLLPLHAKESLIAYIKTFSDRWEEGADEPPISVGGNPWVGASESQLKRARKRGEEVYHGVATCWECHAAYVAEDQIRAYREKIGITSVDIRANVDQPTMKTDAWQNPVWPPDFTKDRIKTGADVENLFRVIAAGIGGTAMPTWKNSLPDEDIWAMAYYVRSLADQRNERITVTRGESAAE